MTVKLAAFEGPTVGCGLEAVTEYAPGNKIAEAGTTAVSCVELTKVVVSKVVKPVEFSANTTCAPLKNPEPLTLRVKPGSPELALVGDIEVSVGGGRKPLL